MSMESALREALHELADEATPVPGMAATALRQVRRRRQTTRVVVATMTTVTAGAAVAVPLGTGLLDGSGDGMAGGPAAAPTSTAATPADPDVLPPPPVHELTGDALLEAYQVCRSGFVNPEDSSSSDRDALREQFYEGWEPVLGVSLDADPGPGLPATWVIFQQGGLFRADCVIDSSGMLIGGGGEYGVKSTPDLLYALVDGQEGEGVGRYVEPVARVTVQYEDKPEQEAVLRGGFWFAPIDSQRWFGENEDEHGFPEPEDSTAGMAIPDLPEPWDGLIGVNPGYTIRGYDADGEVVYDSTTDGPSVEDCYADPTGTEFVGSYAGHTDPSECVVTHPWSSLP